MPSQNRFRCDDLKVLNLHHFPFVNWFRFDSFIVGFASARNLVAG